MMTQEELIDAACEIIGVNVKELSAGQLQGLMSLTQRLADLSVKEQRSFDSLCAIRGIIGAALARGETADDLVTLRLTKGHCEFLLTLVDQGIREHA
jgi:hypothetical protein